MPGSWEPCQSKKGAKRYTNSELRELVKRREAAYDAKERAQGGILQVGGWEALGGWMGGRHMWRGWWEV